MYEGQADSELVKRVLSTNIYVDQRGEPRSAPLLLRYEPQIRSFLKGPTVPRSQEVQVETPVPVLAVPTDTSNLREDPEFIPIGQVSKMAPPINPFEIMGKAMGGSSSGTAKGRGKGRGKGVGKKSTKAASESSPSKQTMQVMSEELPSPLPIIHEIEESDHGEDLAPPKKKSRSEVPPIPAEGASASVEPWVPTLLFGDGLISVHDTVLDETEPDLSSHVAHGLARAACLPGDMNQWDSMSSAQIFRHSTRGLMMVREYLFYLLINFANHHFCVLTSLFIRSGHPGRSCNGVEGPKNDRRTPEEECRLQETGGTTLPQYQLDEGGQRPGPS